MLETATILAIIFILLIAALGHSAIGFGFALIAMPLLTLVAGVKIATPLVALCGTTLAFLIAGANLRTMDIESAGRLILAALVGIPLGLGLILLAPASVVKRILGVVLILVSLYNLSKPNMPALTHSRWIYLFGFLAGILGGAYNTAGPPVVLYGTLRHWPPARFRSTLQAFFAFTGLFILINHAIGGLWSVQIWQLFLMAMPLQLAGIVIGGKINRRIPLPLFTNLLYIGLILLGVLLLI